MFTMYSTYLHSSRYQRYYGTLEERFESRGDFSDSIIPCSVNPPLFLLPFWGPSPAVNSLSYMCFSNGYPPRITRKEKKKKKVVQRYAESDPDIIRKKQAESKPLHIRKTPIHHGSKIKINYVYIS